MRAEARGGSRARRLLPCEVPARPRNSPARAPPRRAARRRIGAVAAAPRGHCLCNPMSAGPSSRRAGAPRVPAAGALRRAPTGARRGSVRAGLSRDARERARARGAARCPWSTTAGAITACAAPRPGLRSPLQAMAPAPGAPATRRAPGSGGPAGSGSAVPRAG